SPFPIPGRFAGRVRTAGIETLDDLRERIEYLRDYARQIGRSDRIDVNFVPFGSRMNSQDPLDPKAFREQLAELESIGVTWLSLGVPGVTRAAYLDSIARFGAEVIGRTSVAGS
ncbi:MAG: hypothetical protein VCC20_05050, partial [Myxococcota bacterium]